MESACSVDRSPLHARSSHCALTRHRLVRPCFGSSHVLTDAISPPARCSGDSPLAEFTARRQVGRVVEPCLTEELQTDFSHDLGRLGGALASPVSLHFSSRGSGGESVACACTRLLVLCH